MSDSDPAVAQKDHDLLMRVDERSEATARRVAEIIDWKHDHLPSIIAEIQKDTLRLRNDLTSLAASVVSTAASVERLSQMMATTIDVPRRQEEHENGCVRARAEDIEHRNYFEKRVEQRFDDSDKARGALYEKIDHTRNWVVRGIVSTLLTLLGATVTIIWVVVQRGGLSVFGH